jgi:hypothetical protein
MVFLCSLFTVLSRQTTRNGECLFRPPSITSWRDWSRSKETLLHSRISAVCPHTAVSKYEDGKLMTDGIQSAADWLSAEILTHCRFHGPLVRKSWFHQCEKIPLVLQARYTGVSKVTLLHDVRVLRHVTTSGTD